MSQLSDKAIEIAKTQIGQDEKPHGSNWGEPIKSYLASVHISFPASWCMAFVYWCFEQAAVTLNIGNNAICSAGCLDVWHKASSVIKSSKPSIGSVVIFDHGKGLGHTGIVYAIDSISIYTIEGNTNNNGSREGFDVEYKKHLMTDKTILVYINY